MITYAVYSAIARQYTDTQPVLSLFCRADTEHWSLTTTVHATVDVPRSSGHGWYDPSPPALSACFRSLFGCPRWDLRDTSNVPSIAEARIQPLTKKCLYGCSDSRQCWNSSTSLTLLSSALRSPRSDVAHPSQAPCSCNKAFWTIPCN